MPHLLDLFPFQRLMQGNALIADQIPSLKNEPPRPFFWLETQKLIQQLEAHLGDWLRGAYRVADPVIREGERLRAAVLMLRAGRVFLVAMPARPAPACHSANRVGQLLSSNCGDQWLMIASQRYSQYLPLQKNSSPASTPQPPACDEKSSRRARLTNAKAPLGLLLRGFFHYFAGCAGFHLTPSFPRRRRPDQGQGRFCAPKSLTVLMYSEGNSR